MVTVVLLVPKPWLRKVRTSRGHLLISKRTILEIWYTSYFFRNKTFLFVKIESCKVQYLAGNSCDVGRDRGFFFTKNPFIISYHKNGCLLRK